MSLLLQGKILIKIFLLSESNLSRYVRNEVERKILEIKFINNICLFRNGKWEKLFIKALNQTAFEGVTVRNHFEIPNSLQVTPQRQLTLKSFCTPPTPATPPCIKQTWSAILPEFFTKINFKMLNLICQRLTVTRLIYEICEILFIV